MKCDDVRRWLHDYVDGGANPMQQRMIEAHLRECSGCRNRMRALERTTVALRSLEQVPAPGGFTCGVMAALPEAAFKSTHQPWYKRRTAWYQVAVAAAIVLLLVGSAEALLPESQASPVVFTRVDSAPLVHEDGVVRLPEGQTLAGDLTIVGGTLVIAGTVKGNIKVVRGQLITTETADIEGDVSILSTGPGSILYSLRAAWYNLVDSIRQR